MNASPLLFASCARMPRKWWTQRRNILADLQKAFGKCRSQVPIWC